MDYYDKKQFLALVDREDSVLGKAEKWDAHKKGLLHRGYTVIITHKGKIVLQHRKHPVFDNVFDLSFSSHQLYEEDVLQTDEAAIYEGLRREWGMEREDIESPPKFLKTIYYRAEDPRSGYIEHEIDYIFQVEALKTPAASADFAYGFRLVEKPALLTGDIRLPSPFAPWVKTLLEEHII